MAQYRRSATAVQHYPELRKLLAPPYRGLPTEEIEQLLGAARIDAAELDEFLKQLGKAVANVAPAILPVAGTVVGTAFGGPLGGAVGGALGSAAGGAISKANQPRSQQPRPQQPRPPQTPVATSTPSTPRATARPTPPASRPTPAPPAAQPQPVVPAAQQPAASAQQQLVGGMPATTQLLQALLRPETIQALLAMALGQVGASNMRVGGATVPVADFSSMLGVLADQASAEYAVVARPRVGTSNYLYDYAGEAAGDPLVAEHRAEALVRLLQDSEPPVNETIPPPRRMRRIRATAPAWYESDDSVYDEMDLLELYSTSENW